MVKPATVVVVVVLLAILAIEAFIANGGPESTIGSDHSSIASAVTSPPRSTATR